jgi:hypothetical protein
MKKFSIFHVPFMSFFSKELYQDVGLYWKGVNFGYLLLLLAVCWIPIIIKIRTVYSGFVREEAPPIVLQVPEITITDGQVSITESQPYYISDPENDDVLAIIDTTGTIISLEDSDAFCLLTKNSLITRKNKFETQTYDLSQVEHFVLDGDRIMSWLQTSKKFLVIAIYPFALLGSYIYRIVQALIYAAIGLLFASFCKVVLSYNTLLRLATVAVTPCIIAGTVFDLAGVSLPAPLYLLAALGYLFFGVKAVSQIPPAEEYLQDSIETESPDQYHNWP